MEKIRKRISNPYNVILKAPKLPVPLLVVDHQKVKLMY
jgi:hypothetical protein